jgi:putative transposase
MLCYCLMPNHFHWLFFVRELSIARPDLNSPGDSKSPGEYAHRTLNDSIAILLRSYTRAINKQENRSGALFREDTKAKDGWIEGFIALENRRTRSQFWNDYGFTCFQYIHENPVEAHLVARAEDWVYSSCQDYLGLRNGTLCNKTLAKELLNLPQ